MFKEMDGPTALRRELVQGLALSRGTAMLDDERCCAALAGVWNGKKGFVAVLVRQLDPPKVRRWVYEDRLKDVDSVSTAVEAGLSFVSSLGFDMDSPAFAELALNEQSRRVDDWNDLRKESRQPRISREEAPESAAPEPITADEHGGAVLGRLSLIRRGGGYANPLARLLSYF